MYNNLIPVDEDSGCRLLSIYANNSKEWIMTDLMSMIHGATLAPLYSTLGKDSIVYILDQTKAKTLMLDEKNVNNIIELKKSGKIKNLKNLVYMYGGLIS